MRKQMTGFTAIELLVVIAIVAILAGLAMPSFQLIMAKMQVEKDIEALRSSIFLARSEAMKLGGNVQIRKLPATAAGLTNAVCQNARDWSCGWQVVRTAPTETVIRQYPSKGNSDVMFDIGGGASVISLNRWGVTNAGFRFNVQHKKLSNEVSKTICVSSGGGFTVKDSCTN